MTGKKTKFFELRKEENITLENLAKGLSEIAGFPIDRQKIGRIENGQEIDTSTLKAYCKRFNVSADYLLGLSEVRTKNIEIKEINKKLGLSEDAIKRIMNFDEEKQKVLDMIISDSYFYEFIAKTQNYLHSGNIGVVFPDMTKPEEIEHENDEYIINGSLQFDSAIIHQLLICEILKKILDNICTI